MGLRVSLLPKSMCLGGWVLGGCGASPFLFFTPRGLFVLRQELRDVGGREGKV